MKTLEDLEYVTFPPSGRVLSYCLDVGVRTQLQFWRWLDCKRGKLPQYHAVKVVEPSNPFVGIGFLPMAFRTRDRLRHIGEPTDRCNALRICSLANEELNLRGSEWN